MKKILPALLVAINLVHAQTVYYITQTGAGLKDGSSWANAGDSGMVQSIINAALLNSQIWIAAGTYKPNAYPVGCTNCSVPLQYSFKLRDGVSLYGGFAGTETSISQADAVLNHTIFSGDIGVVGDSSDNCLHVLIASRIGYFYSTNVSGINFTKGYAHYYTGSSSMHIGNSRFSEVKGSGAYVRDSKVFFTDCTFEGNLRDGFTADSSQSSLYNCNFIYNTGYGATFDKSRGDTLANCKISNNYGGFYISDGGINVRHCEITNNSRIGRGAGVYLNYSHDNFDNCLISNNSSTEGIAVASYHAYSWFENCVFYQNSSPNPYSSVIEHIDSSTVRFNLCTFFANSATNFNYSASGSNGQFYSCIIWGNVTNGPAIFNDPGTIPSPSTYVFNCDIQDPGYAGQNYNLYADPRFIDTANAAGADNTWGTADDGLNLLCGSPCINQSEIYSTIPITDFAGTPRPQDSIYDIGAYEQIVPKLSITQFPNPVCTGDTVTLSVQSINVGLNPVYSWQLNSNSIGTNSATLSVVVNSGDTIRCFIRSTMPAYCLYDTVISDIRAVNIALPPSAAITPSGSTTICQGSSVVLAVPAGNTYHWSTGAITSSITVSQAGSYMVTVSSSNNCTAASSPVTVTVNPTFVPSVAVSASKTIICPGESVTFTAVPTNGGNANYLWFKNGINTGFSGSPYITGNLANNDQITVRMTSSLTCVTQQTVFSSAVTITLDSLPSSNVSASGSLSFCNGKTITLTATSGNTYHWSTGATTQSITASQSGTYLVTVTSPANCTVVSAPKIVTVYPLPAAPVITQNLNTLSSNAPSGNHWCLNGIFINGATSQTYSPDSSGNYYVIVIDGNGCSSPPSNTISFNYSGIEELSENDIMVYPNPAIDKLIVANLRVGTSLIITDHLGRVVIKDIMKGERKEIDVSRLPAGMYFINKRKLVKE